MRKAYPFWFTGYHPIYQVFSFIQDLSLMPELLQDAITNWIYSSTLATSTKIRGLILSGKNSTKSYSRESMPTQSIPHGKSLLTFKLSSQRSKRRLCMQQSPHHHHIHMEERRLTINLIW